MTGMSQYTYDLNVWTSSLVIARVHNIYIEESVLLSYTPVEGHIVKF